MKFGLEDQWSWENYPNAANFIQVPWTHVKSFVTHFCALKLHSSLVKGKRSSFNTGVIIALRELGVQLGQPAQHWTELQLLSWARDTNFKAGTMPPAKSSRQWFPATQETRMVLEKYSKNSGKPCLVQALNGYKNMNSQRESDMISQSQQKISSLGYKLGPSSQGKPGALPQGKSDISSQGMPGTLFRVKLEISPQNTPGMSPHGNLGTLPQGMPGMSSQVKVGLSPQNKPGTSSQGKPGTLLKGKSGTLPKGKSGTLPKGRSGTLPKGNLGTLPKGKSDRSPQGMQRTSSQIKLELSPRNKPGTSPHGKPGMLPQGKSDVSPQGMLGMSSQVKPGLSPHNKPGTSSQGKPGMLPQGKLVTLPQGKSDMSPQGMQRTSSQGKLGLSLQNKPGTSLYGNIGKSPQGKLGTSSQSMTSSQLKPGVSPWKKPWTSPPGKPGTPPQGKQEESPQGNPGTLLWANPQKQHDVCATADFIAQNDQVWSLGSVVLAKASKRSKRWFPAMVYAPTNFDLFLERQDTHYDVLWMGYGTTSVVPNHQVKSFVKHFGRLKITTNLGRNFKTGILLALRELGVQLGQPAQQWTETQLLSWAKDDNFKAGAMLHAKTGMQWTPATKEIRVVLEACQKNIYDRCPIKAVHGTSPQDKPGTSPQDEPEISPQRGPDMSPQSNRETLLQDNPGTLLQEKPEQLDPCSASVDSNAQNAQVWPRGSVVLAKLSKNHNRWFPAVVISLQDSGPVPCYKESNCNILWLGYGTTSVHIFGQRIRIEEISKSLTTIPWELICSFTIWFERLNISDSINSARGNSYKVGVLTALKELGVNLGHTTQQWTEQQLFSWAQDAKFKAGSLPPAKTGKQWSPATPEIRMALEACRRSNFRLRPAEVLREITAKQLKSGTKRVEEICLACRQPHSVPTYEHPLFHGGLCIQCLEVLQSSFYTLGADNLSICGSICGQEGFLVYCSNYSCNRAYCQECLNLLDGERCFERASEDKYWLCALCIETKPQNLLIKRPDWQERLNSLDIICTEVHHPGEDILPPPVPDPEDCKKLRVLSLFNGIGTALYILRDCLNLDIEAFFSSEICPNANSVAEKNSRGLVQHLGDVRDIDIKKIRDLGRIDLLIGGSPCKELSSVNAIRCGFTDAASSAYLLEEYSRILFILETLGEVNGHPMFWLYENVSSMDLQDREIITRKLKMTQPILVNASQFSGMQRSRLFWGNIPGMFKRRPFCGDFPLQDVLDKGAIAMCKKISTITTNPNSHVLSLRSGGRHRNINNNLPVMQNGKLRKLNIGEMESLFGFPRGYTEVVGLNESQRFKLLGEAWSSQTVACLLNGLKCYFSQLKKNAAKKRKTRQSSRVKKRSR